MGRHIDEGGAIRAKNSNRKDDGRNSSSTVTKLTR